MSKEIVGFVMFVVWVVAIFGIIITAILNSYDIYYSEELRDGIVIFLFSYYAFVTPLIAMYLMYWSKTKPQTKKSPN